MELWDRSEAQDKPASPDPMMMTSVVWGIGWFVLELLNICRDVGDFAFWMLDCWKEEEEEGVKLCTIVNRSGTTAIIAET